MPEFSKAAAFPFPMQLVFKAVLQAVQVLPGWSAREVYEPQGYLTVSVGFNILSYGENVAIQVTESPPGTSWISVSSASKFALFDMGKNRMNIDKLFHEVQDVLGQWGYPSSYREVPAASEPQAASAVQCPSCGTTLAAGAIFCTGCGIALGAPLAPGDEGSGCPSCGAETSPGARFCRNCGQALGRTPGS